MKLVMGFGNSVNKVFKCQDSGLLVGCSVGLGVDSGVGDGVDSDDLIIFGLHNEYNIGSSGGYFDGFYNGNIFVHW